jgi:hypothetical protein
VPFRILAESCIAVDDFELVSLERAESHAAAVDVKETLP